jgi:hypothetical protein
MPIENAGGIPLLGYVWRYDTYNRAVTLGSLVIPLLIIALIISAVYKSIACYAPTGSGLIHKGTARRAPTESARSYSRWFWLAVAVVPLLLSVGAFVQIGEARIEAPYVLLHRLFGGLFRSPARFDGVIIIAVLLFVGKTLTPLVKGRRLPVAAAALLLVALDARLFSPMPIQPVTTPYAYYETIGAERGAPYDDEVVLEVPVAGGSGEAWVGEFRPMEAQFYGITHGKRMLNGAVARAPLESFWYWLYDDPMLAWLGGRRYLEPETVETQFRERIFDWKIGYVVVHQDWIGRDTVTNQEVLGYLNSLRDLLCPIAVQGDAVFYRTAWHPDGCPARTPPETSAGVYALDIGSSGDEAYIGWGWHYAEGVSGITLRWAGEYPQTQVYVALPPATYTVTVAAQAFYEPRQLRLLVNGRALGEAQTVTVDGLHEYSFALPADVTGDGKGVTLTLDYDAVVTPADVGQGGDTRKLAVAVDWIRWTEQ